MSEEDVRKAFSYYAKRSLINKTRSMRAKEQHQVSEIPLVEEAIGKLVLDKSQSLVFLSPDQINQFEDYIENEQLAFIISQLTDRQKQIFYYKYIEGYTEQEIADKFHVGRTAISNQHRKVLNKIWKS